VGTEGHADPAVVQPRLGRQERYRGDQPGPNAAIVKSVTIDYSNSSSWVVKLEAEGRDAAGKLVQITVDARLENIGAYRRLLRGTWTQGSQKGAFIVTRN
jgi:hypothetical protein